MLQFVLCCVLLKIIGNVESTKPKSVNLALETVLAFDHKDNSANIKFIDDVQNFLTKVRKAVNKVPERRRYKADKFKFTDFIKQLIEVLKSYDNDDLEDVVAVVDDEIRKYHYKGCKFYELVEGSDLRRFVANKLDMVKKKPAKDIRRNLERTLRNLKDANFNTRHKEILDYVNSLYSREDGNEFKEILENFQIYKMKSKRSNMDLIHLVKDSIRDKIFDHYSSLNLNTRREFKLKIETFWKNKKENASFGHRLWKIQYPKADKIIENTDRQLDSDEPKDELFKSEKLVTLTQYKNKSNTKKNKKEVARNIKKDKQRHDESETDGYDYFDMTVSNEGEDEKENEYKEEKPKTIGSIPKLSHKKHGKRNLKKKYSVSTEENESIEDEDVKVTRPIESENESSLYLMGVIKKVTEPIEADGDSSDYNKDVSKTNNFAKNKHHKKHKMTTEIFINIDSKELARPLRGRHDDERNGIAKSKNKHHNKKPKFISLYPETVKPTSKKRRFKIESTTKASRLRVHTIWEENIYKPKNKNKKIKVNDATPDNHVDISVHRTEMPQSAYRSKLRNSKNDGKNIKSFMTKAKDNEYIENHNINLKHNDKSLYYVKTENEDKVDKLKDDNTRFLKSIYASVERDHQLNFIFSTQKTTEDQDQRSNNFTHRSMNAVIEEFPSTTPDNQRVQKSKEKVTTSYQYPVVKKSKDLKSDNVQERLKLRERSTEEDTYNTSGEKDKEIELYSTEKNYKVEKSTKKKNLYLTRKETVEKSAEEEMYTTKGNKVDKSSNKVKSYATTKTETVTEKEFYLFPEKSTERKLYTSTEKEKIVDESEKEVYTSLQHNHETVEKSTEEDLSIATVKQKNIKESKEEHEMYYTKKTTRTVEPDTEEELNITPKDKKSIETSTEEVEDDKKTISQREILVEHFPGIQNITSVSSTTIANLNKNTTGKNSEEATTAKSLTKDKNKETLHSNKHDETKNPADLVVATTDQIVENIRVDLNRLKMAKTKDDNVLAAIKLNNPIMRASSEKEEGISIESYEVKKSFRKSNDGDKNYDIFNQNHFKTQTGVGTRKTITAQITDKSKIDINVDPKANKYFPPLDFDEGTTKNIETTTSPTRDGTTNLATAHNNNTTTVRETKEEKRFSTRNINNKHHTQSITTSSRAQETAATKTMAQSETTTASSRFIYVAPSKMTKVSQDTKTESDKENFTADSNYSMELLSKAPQHKTRADDKIDTAPFADEKADAVETVDAELEQLFEKYNVAPPAPANYSLPLIDLAPILGDMKQTTQGIDLHAYLAGSSTPKGFLEAAAKEINIQKAEAKNEAKVNKDMYKLFGSTVILKEPSEAKGQGKTTKRHFFTDPFEDMDNALDMLM